MPTPQPGTRARCCNFLPGGVGRAQLHCGLFFSLLLLLFVVAAFIMNQFLPWQVQRPVLRRVRCTTRGHGAGAPRHHPPASQGRPAKSLRIAVACVVLDCLLSGGVLACCCFSCLVAPSSVRTRVLSTLLWCVSCGVRLALTKSEQRQTQRGRETEHLCFRARSSLVTYLASPSPRRFNMESTTAANITGNHDHGAHPQRRVQPVGRPQGSSSNDVSPSWRFVRVQAA